MRPSCRQRRNSARATGAMRARRPRSTELTKGDQELCANRRVIVHAAMTQIVLAVACLPTIDGFPTVPSPLSPLRNGGFVNRWGMGPDVGTEQLSRWGMGPDVCTEQLRRSVRSDWKATLDSAGMRGRAKGGSSRRATAASREAAVALDEAESVALEQLSSILETDDGLRLSGAEMRDARSNWVRDIMSTGSSRVLSKVSCSCCACRHLVFSSSAYAFTHTPTRTRRTHPESDKEKQERSQGRR